MTTSDLKKMENNMTKFENKTNQYKKRAKKVLGSWKAKILAILIGITLFLAMLAISFYQIVHWFKVYDINFHTPIEVRTYNMVSIVKRYISPVLTEKDVESSKNELIRNQKEIDRQRLVERLYQYVRYLESEIGFNERQDATHIYCQNIGKVNEIGYFPGGNKKYCFSSEEKQKEGFMFEYNDRMKKGYTIKEFLCEWVTGDRQPMCKRSMDIGL